MSCDKPNDFEDLLSNRDTNDIIVSLINDHAFSVEFLASCVANYYLTVLKKESPCPTK